MQPERAQAAGSGEAASTAGYGGGGSPVLQGREPERKAGTPLYSPMGSLDDARGEALLKVKTSIR